MADKRKKTHGILLDVDGKSISIEVFAAEQWPQESTKEGHFRLRINGKWYCPAGKYSFLSYVSIGELISTLLAGGEALQAEDRPQFAMRQRVNVFTGECVEGLPLEKRRGVVLSPVWRGADGQWRVFVAIDDYVREALCHDVEPLTIDRADYGLAASA